jgi:hypothetical protein
VTASDATVPRYSIQPYHMNGLNWRLAPDDPSRDDIVIVTGFMPSWWTQDPGNGIRFGAEFHLDPEVHRATLARMEAILRQRFGDLPNFFCGDDYANALCMERRYGDALVPALFGGAVSFDDASGHPYAPSLRLPAAEAEALVAPDLAAHPIVRSLLPPGPLGGAGAGGPDAGLRRVAGELGFEGVINIAYKLRDYAIFLDLMEAPRRAHHIFEVTWQTIDALVHMVRDWQDPAGRRPSYFVNCNCLVNMLSPRLYRQQLLEFDQRFRASFDLFGIHTCNWVVDPYLDALAEIPGLAYLDMGEGSDLERVHRLFPDLQPSVFVHPQRFVEMTEREIERHIEALGRRIGRGYILLSDLEAGTRDSQIRAAYEAAARLA